MVTRLTGYTPMNEVKETRNGLGKSLLNRSLANGRVAPMLKFKKPVYIIAMLVVGALLVVNAIVASRYEDSPDLDDISLTSLTFLQGVNTTVCPTCQDCTDWDTWNHKVETGLGSCTLAPSPHADWNVAFAHPGGKGLGRVTFWSCNLMMFKNTGGFTSPLAGSYEAGDCINITQRDCTLGEWDDWGY